MPEPKVVEYRLSHAALTDLDAGYALPLDLPTLGAFEFSLTGDVGPDGAMVLDWAFRTEARVVPADAVAGVLEDASAVSDATWLSWDLSQK